MRIAPSVGPVQGSQATANASPATIGPPVWARRMQLLGAPLAVEQRHEQRGDEEHAHQRRCTTPEIWRSSGAVVAGASGRGRWRSCRAPRTSTREGEAEEQRRPEHPGPAAALLDVGERDAGDRRQVAGHERQHAGRDERDEADPEGGDDRGVDRVGARSQVVALHVGVERGRESAGGRARVGPRARAPPRQRVSGEARSPPSASRIAERRDHVDEHVLEVAVAVVAGQGEHLSPNCATSASLISSFERQSAIRRSMNSRSRWAWGASVASAERGAADRAHHLVLDVAERGLRAVGGERARGQQRERGGGERRAASAPHARSRSSGSDLLAHELVVHRPAPHGGDAAAAVDHEGLREAEDAEVSRRSPVAVAQHRVGELVLATKSRASSVTSCTSTPSTVPPCLRDALVPALEQRRLLAAGLAPGGPEVEHHHLPAVVGERLGAAARQPRQLERRRRLALAAPERAPRRRGRARSGEPVGEQREERHEHRRERRAGQGQAAGAWPSRTIEAGLESTPQRSATATRT